MKHNYDKSKFLEVLRESPWISLASKKAGISRATIYRWMKDIPEFRREVDRAIKAGNSQLGEMAEMGLVKNIKEGNLNAIKFYLINNNPKYTPKRSIDPPPFLVHQHSDESEACELCIRVAIEKEVKEEEMKKKIREEVRRMLNPKTKKDKEDRKKLMMMTKNFGIANRRKYRESM